MPRRPRNQALADEVGRRIRAARVDAGMSQEQLADLAGLHRTYIGHLESGRVMPSIDSVALVAGALGLTMSALLADIEDTVSR